MLRPLADIRSILYPSAMTDEEWHLLRALAMMCAQYIGEGEHLDHQCMSAGEEAVNQLVKYGMIEPAGRGGRWTEAGHALLR